jgi:hypothetical protein
LSKTVIKCQNIGKGFYVTVLGHGIECGKKKPKVMRSLRKTIMIDQKYLENCGMFEIFG